MRRSKKPEESHNHERWLVSYADFITLLFAFFVVMYSVSSVNEGKYKVLSKTLEGVFSVTQRTFNPIEVGDLQTAQPDSEEPVARIFPVPEQGVDAENADDSSGGGESSQLHEISDRFHSMMQKFIDEGVVTINENENWIEMSVRNSLLFGSGDAVPVKAAFPLIDKIADVIKDYPHALLIEGFTDNIPIRSSVYPSNWELSTARAAAIVRLLAFGGVAQNRMAAIGYGEYQPIARNDTPEGRKRNRRVVILVAKGEKVRLTLRK